MTDASQGRSQRWLTIKRSPAASWLVCFVLLYLHVVACSPAITSTGVPPIDLFWRTTAVFLTPAFFGAVAFFDDRLSTRIKCGIAVVLGGSFCSAIAVVNLTSARPHLGDAQALIAMSLPEILTLFALLTPLTGLLAIASDVLCVNLFARARAFYSSNDAHTIPRFTLSGCLAATLLLAAAFAYVALMWPHSR